MYINDYFKLCLKGILAIISLMILFLVIGAIIYQLGFTFGEPPSLKHYMAVGAVSTVAIFIVGVVIPLIGMLVEVAKDDLLS